MVAGLLAPIGLYAAALGAGFLLPLIARRSEALARGLFFLTLLYMLLLAGVWLLRLSDGAAPVEILTAGIRPPFSINLRLGLFEAWVVCAVNLTGLLGGWYLLDQLRGRAAALSVYLVLIMGIDGMVMTRDLFNLFIFIEITAISTYGLLALGRGGASLSAAFKYIIATSLASSFFLLGTLLFYHLTGTLNLDDMLAHRQQIAGPLGLIGGSLLLAGMLIELKPYPANGWGLDVYESAPPGVAALVSVGVSAGALFALYKVLPLLPDLLLLTAAVAGATFLVSNLIGLRQRNPRRLLGYSSIAQMSLMVLAMVLLKLLGRMEYLPLIVGGLFLNHLLAKAALFWLTGLVERSRTEQWSLLRSQPFLLLLFGVALAALVGFPPFPGFWAKWELIMQLAAGGKGGWILLILLGSLLEAAYLFRWFGLALARDESQEGQAPIPLPQARLLPVAVFVPLLLAVGQLMVGWLDLRPLIMLPVYAAILFYLLDFLPGRVKAGLMLLAFAAYSSLVIQQLQGLSWLFSLILLGGGALVSIAMLNRGDIRRGFYPFVTLLLFSLAALLQAETSLEFFFAWELLTLGSYQIYAMGREGSPTHVLTYLVFSLASAFLILAGFGFAYAQSGSLLLADLQRVDARAPLVLGLLLGGFLIKAGCLGVHIWLPDAYTETDDDFTPLLSAVVGKAAIFGLLLVVLQLAVGRGGATDWILYAMGWLGLLTAFWGALMALFQEDVKKLLAYSSMGQVGYIVTAVAITSQLGWVSAGYLTINHLLFKGLLFLAAAGLIYRTNTRLMYQMGGLIKNLPLTFVSVLIGIIAISGVPPLSGFGSKWLLINALLERGWYWQAGLAFFASAVAFLYLFRLIHTVFLGQRKPAHKGLREAPPILLLPQFVLIACIMVFSIWPKGVIEPINAAIASQFPQTLVWEGSLLKSHLGYWDGFTIMLIVAGIFLSSLAILLFQTRFMRVQRVEQFNIVYAAERPQTPETTHFAYNFFAFYKRVMGPLIRPRATRFWQAVSEWSHTSGSILRGLYTGNGQTYAMYVLFYVVFIYIASGGMG